MVALDDFEEIDYSESEDIAPKDSIPNSQENEATETLSPQKKILKRELPTVSPMIPSSGIHSRGLTERILRIRFGNQ